MPAPPIPVALTGGVNVPLRNGIAGNDSQKGFTSFGGAADAPAGVETTESVSLLLELIGLLGVDLLLLWQSAKVQHPLVAIGRLKYSEFDFRQWMQLLKDLKT